MRIGVDCRMYYSSGIGTYLQNLIPLIVLMRPDITYYLLGDRTKLSSYSWTQNGNVICVECHSPIYSIAEQFELIRKTPACDVFFSPHYNIPLFYRGNLITTIHDVFHIARENTDKTLAKILYARTMLTAALRKSKAVMTDSHFTLEEMREYGLPCLEKVRVAYIGFGLEKINGRNPDKAVGDSYLLYVGNVKTHKNLRRLIDAYKLLHRANKISIPLIIVGEADNFITGMPELKEEVLHSSWNRWIQFTGWIDDDELKGYYKNAVALVQPSIYEGFGLPPLEAMSCGCPCIVSKAASLPEVCGNAVLYFDPYQVEDIAEKIDILLNDNGLKNRLINLGFEQVKKFSWQESAAAFLNLVDETIDT